MCSKPALFLSVADVLAKICKALLFRLICAILHTDAYVACHEIFSHRLNKMEKSVLVILTSGGISKGTLASIVLLIRQRLTKSEYVEECLKLKKRLEILFAGKELWVWIHLSC